MVRFLIGIMGIFLASASLAIAAPSPERQQELRNLLIQDCGSCQPEALAGKSPEFLRHTIVQGRPGTPMPPWGGLLSDADIDWLVKILLAGEAAP